MRRVLRIGLSLCASTGPIFFSGHFFMGRILCDTISWCAGPIQKAGANMGPASSCLAGRCQHGTHGGAGPAHVLAERVREAFSFARPQ
jgi:hypothetical protein